jgi:hypothetical protein
MPALYKNKKLIYCWVLICFIVPAHWGKKTVQRETCRYTWTHYPDFKPTTCTLTIIPSIIDTVVRSQLKYLLLIHCFENWGVLIDQSNFRVRLGLWCLTPLSTIFQSYFSKQLESEYLMQLLICDLTTVSMIDGIMVSVHVVGLKSG